MTDINIPLSASLFPEAVNQHLNNKNNTKARLIIKNKRGTPLYMEKPVKEWSDSILSAMQIPHQWHNEGFEVYLQDQKIGDSSIN